MDIHKDLFGKICRICLSLNNSKTVSLFDGNNELSSYGQAVVTSTGVQIAELKSAPQNMCHKCLYQLQECILFRKKCQISHNYFSNINYEENSKETILKNLQSNRNLVLNDRNAEIKYLNVLNLGGTKMGGLNIKDDVVSNIKADFPHLSSVDIVIESQNDNLNDNFDDRDGNIAFDNDIKHTITVAEAILGSQFNNSNDNLKSTAENKIFDYKKETDAKNFNIKSRLYHGYTDKNNYVKIKPKANGIQIKDNNLPSTSAIIKKEKIDIKIKEEKPKIHKNDDDDFFNMFENDQKPNYFFNTIEETIHTKIINQIHKSHLQNENIKSNIVKIKRNAEKLQSLKSKTDKRLNKNTIKRKILTKNFLNKQRYLKEVFMAKRRNIKVYPRRYSTETEDDDKPDLSCKICKKVFKTKGGLRNHFMKHSGKAQFICETCGKAYYSPGDLQRHIAWAHRLGPQHPCDQCDFKTTFLWELRQHKRIHTGERPFVCDLCGRAFRLKQIWRNHQIYHGEKKHQCPKCPRKFFKYGALRDHDNSVHSRRYMYACIQCGRQYAWSRDVRRHLVKEHAVPRDKQGRIPKVFLDKSDEAPEDN